MSGPYTPCAPGVQTLINAQSADESQGVLYLRGQCRAATVVLQGNGTTSSGVIEIEEAYYNQDAGQPQYAGRWSTITTAINASELTGDAQQAIHIPASLWALKVRISTAIGGGGTITAVAWGN